MSNILQWVPYGQLVVQPHFGGVEPLNPVTSPGDVSKAQFRISSMLLPVNMVFHRFPPCTPQNQHLIDIQNHFHHKRFLRMIAIFSCIFMRQSPHKFGHFQPLYPLEELALGQIFRCLSLVGHKNGGCRARVTLWWTNILPWKMAIYSGFSH